MNYFFDNLPEIIEKSSRNFLSIIVLVIIVLSTIAFLFFKRSKTNIKIITFYTLLSSLFFLIFIVINVGINLRNNSNILDKKDESNINKQKVDSLIKDSSKKTQIIDNASNNADNKIMNKDTGSLIFPKSVSINVPDEEIVQVSLNYYNLRVIDKTIRTNNLYKDLNKNIIVVKYRNGSNKKAKIMIMKENNQLTLKID